MSLSTQNPTNLPSQIVTINVDDTTISLIDTPLASTTLTVAKTGTYLCLFEGIAHNSNAAGSVFASMYVNGVKQTTSERHITSNNDKSLVIHAIFALKLGDVINIDWRVDGNTGTMHDRSLTIVRLAS